MKKTIILILFTFGLLVYAQKSPIGIFQNMQFEIQFNDDNTFLYKNKFGLNPAGNKVDYDYSEKGQWLMLDDTIILNPHLQNMNFGRNEIVENHIKNRNKIYFQFNIIREYYDKNNTKYNTDTLQIESIDLAFDNFKRKNRLRITKSPTTKCAMAGYIPKELVTNDRNIELKKPNKKFTKIYFESWEIGELIEYNIKNANSNSITLNIYQYIYDDGMIRNLKYLMLSENTILTNQMPNGKFKKDGWFYDYSEIKRK